MKKIFIKEKLESIDVHLEDIVLGDFDAIGEYTAKKNRTPDKDQYRTAGCFFRPNYERGILMYYLTRKKEFKTVLEIGFGRGYAAFCMAKAMCDHGIEGKITTIDPNFDENFLNQLTKVFPKNWFDKLEFVRSTADAYFADNPEVKFDFIYIDGDHRYEAVKNDWNNSKDRFNKALLFDDYHLPSKRQKDIECSKVIDDISDYEKELIIMDRRIFFDDRRIADDQIDYGQVLIEKE